MKKQLIQVAFIIIFSVSVVVFLIYLPTFFTAKKIFKLSQTYVQNFFESEQEAQNKQQSGQQLLAQINKFTKKIQLINYLAQVLPTNKSQQKYWQQLTEHTKNIQIIANWLFTEQRNIIFLLQNSHEIRATGGFIGSYARLELNNGQLQELYFNDIYAADGQFVGFVQAPFPVAKYLTNGGSWRLPDSNWHPDFSQSAKIITQFFNNCGEQNLDALIAVNLALIEKVLVVTGPIYLNDYQLEVNANNLANVARSERENFFPGTKQKQQFFTLLFNQLKFKLAKLNRQQMVLLANVIAEALPEKDLQLYFNEPQIQKVVKRYHWGGEIYLPLLAEQNILIDPTLQHPAYLMLIESNIGINKANQQVSRSVNLTVQNNQLLLNINFDNQNLPPILAMSSNRFINQANHLAYINYQRIILPPSALIEEVAIDGKIIKQFDENLIYNSQGTAFKEVGFLINLPEKTQAQVKIKISYQQSIESLFIQKQAGLPKTVYSIVGQNNEKFELKNDVLVSF